MTTARVREVRLKRRPVGLPSLADFEFADVELSAPAAGEVAVRNLWMSVDPYMRGRMNDRPSYVPPFQLGEALQGGAIGRVEASNDPAYQPGDLVLSMFGWREAFVASAASLQKLPSDGMAPQAYLGVLGMPGMTAYAGFHRIGEPKEGETVFVSGAAGAVGATVCQIAKIRGCRVVASAGSDEKLAWLKSVGVDAAINYKTTVNLLDAVRAAAPKGVDIYFDNVGGEHLEVAIEAARPFARIIACGMISEYNEPAPGPRNMTYFVGKRLKMQGFISFDFADMHGQFLADMTPWVREGRIVFRETIVQGLENAPAAFLSLFSGANIGKMLVKLDA